MNKKYIVALSVLAGLWVSYMVYRHFTGKQDTAEFRDKEYSRITIAARQSPRAGLHQMGQALEQYYEEHKTYPSSLVELYPKHLNNKSFIEDIDWYYERRGDNFYLSKTVIRDNRRMVASIDKGLRARVETGVMVAAPTISPEQKEGTKLEEGVGGRPGMSIRSRREFWAALRRGQLGERPLTEREEPKFVPIIERTMVSMVESELPSQTEQEISKKYLVWKGPGGILGFGNVEYPAAERQTVYAGGSWYDISLPLAKESEPSVPEARMAETKQDQDEVASHLSESYLVWKGEHHILGFGNVALPDREHVYVFQTDTWVSVKRPPVRAEASTEEGPEPQESKSPEKIASTLSQRYLVWKDQKNALGFGNVQYPEKGRVSVFQDDTWVGVERPVVPEGKGSEGQLKHREARSSEEIAPEIGTKYLVWKDQQGTLGFGNVEYPDTKGMAYVHVNGSWERVVN